MKNVTELNEILRLFSANSRPESGQYSRNPITGQTINNWPKQQRDEDNQAVMIMRAHMNDTGLPFDQAKADFLNQLSRYTVEAQWQGTKNSLYSAVSRMQRVHMHPEERVYVQGSHI